MVRCSQLRDLSSLPSPLRPPSSDPRSPTSAPGSPIYLSTFQIPTFSFLSHSLQSSSMLLFLSSKFPSSHLSLLLIVKFSSIFAFSFFPFCSTLYFILHYSFPSFPHLSPASTFTFIGNLELSHFHSQFLKKFNGFEWLSQTKYWKKHEDCSGISLGFY
jgi:hypothetical protein